MSAQKLTSSQLIETVFRITFTLKETLPTRLGDRWLNGLNG